jgi:hypothetical protein
MCHTCASLGCVATCGVGSDQITKRRRLVRLHHPCSIERFHCAISRVWRSHLSLSLITSPRIDLGLLVRIRRNFFGFTMLQNPSLLFSTRYAHSFVYSKRWDWQSHRKLGAKFLVVLCAGSTLLLIEDALTSIVNGALVGVWLFPGFDKPWFLTEGKFATMLIIPSSWGSQLDGDLHQHCAASRFSRAYLGNNIMN